MRVGGADNASVRYQFNINNTARECDPAGPGQATLKVGISGEVVIGPAGSAGTYSAPLKITVTHNGDNKEVFSKTYKIEATTDGLRAGVFRLVTDPIPLPMPTLQLVDLYSITVGFANAGAPAKTPSAEEERWLRIPAGFDKARAVGLARASSVKDTSRKSPAVRRRRRRRNRPGNAQAHGPRG